MIRRLVHFGVAACLLLAPGIAQAASFPDQGAAYTKCMADIANGPTYWQPMRCNESLGNDGSGWYDAWDRTGRSVGWGLYSWSRGNSCKTRAEETGWQGGGTAGIVNVCHSGCMYSSSLDPEVPSGFRYYPTGGSCTQTDAPEPTPAGDEGWQGIVTDTARSSLTD